MRKYESEYTGYTFDNSNASWTSKEEVKSKLLAVDLDSNEPIEAGGLPVMVEGRTAYIDTNDGHTAFEAISGMKKSICGFMPLIYMLGRASENMIITDPKGELYNRTSGYLRTLGYKTICLNFRTLDQDAFNIMEYPAITYRYKDKDKGAMLLSNMLEALAAKQKRSSKVDPYWCDTATKFMYGTGMIMFESYPRMESINVLSWANMNTEDQISHLRSIASTVKTKNAAMTGLREVLSEPEKTLMSTVTTAGTFLAPFLKNEKLVRMLSHSTFSLGDLCKPKTALYIITDDTTTTYDEIVGIIISQIQTYLIERAYGLPHEHLVTRVNNILDEFATYPLPPEQIQNALSTNRSRGIRYYLCIQSIAGLKAQYPEVYDALLLNCATTVYMGSTESEMLARISRQCGNTNITLDGTEKPLISEAELMALKKDWSFKEAIYLNLSESIKYCTELPSIETYGITDERPCIKHNEYPDVDVYTIDELISEVNSGKVYIPFSELKKTRGVKDKITTKELEEKFNLLFGPITD